MRSICNAFDIAFSNSTQTTDQHLLVVSCVRSGLSASDRSSEEGLNMDMSIKSIASLPKKIQYCLRHDVPIVHVDWLWQSARCGNLLDFDGFLWKTYIPTTANISLGVPRIVRLMCKNLSLLLPLESLPRFCSIDFSSVSIHTYIRTFFSSCVVENILVNYRIIMKVGTREISFPFLC